MSASILQYPQHSAQIYASALEQSNCLVRCLLCDDLLSHPFKLAIILELSESDFISWRSTSEALLESVPKDAIIFFNNKMHCPVFLKKMRSQRE